MVDAMNGRKEHPTSSLWLLMLAAICGLSAPQGALAQLPQTALRLAIDADILSVGWTKLVPDDGSARTQTTVGVGPNQFGASQVALPSAPIGFGVGYVLRPKILLGARVGFGFDRSSSAAGEPAASYLTWTFMPGISYVPFGDRAKFFLNFSPLLEFTRRKQGDAQQVRFGGCYSFGAGTMAFLTPSSSVDVGAHFEGRFPDVDEKPEAKTSISDLRWLVRAGLSLWR
jgi:hypothetical protein